MMTFVPQVNTVLFRAGLQPYQHKANSLEQTVLNGFNKDVFSKQVLFAGKPTEAQKKARTQYLDRRIGMSWHRHGEDLVRLPIRDLEMRIANLNRQIEQRRWEKSAYGLLADAPEVINRKADNLDGIFKPYPWRKYSKLLMQSIDTIQNRAGFLTRLLKTEQWKLTPGLLIFPSETIDANFRIFQKLGIKLRAPLSSVEAQMHPKDGTISYFTLAQSTEKLKTKLDKICTRMFGKEFDALSKDELASLKRYLKPRPSFIGASRTIRWVADHIESVPVMI